MQHWKKGTFFGWPILHISNRVLLLNSVWYWIFLAPLTPKMWKWPINIKGKVKNSNFVFLIWKQLGRGHFLPPLHQLGLRWEAILKKEMVPFSTEYIDYIFSTDGSPEPASIDNISVEPFPILVQNGASVTLAVQANKRKKEKNLANKRK